MRNRHKDIRILIEHASAELPPILIDYRIASDQCVPLPDKQKVAIKSWLENLKSCLDYLANDIRATFHPDAATGSDGTGSFPFSNDAKHFAGVVNKFCPGLNATSPPIYAILEELGYDKPASLWLKWFNRARNANTHRGLLSSQEQTTSDRLHLNQNGDEFFRMGTTGRAFIFNSQLRTKQGRIVHIGQLSVTDGEVYSDDPTVTSSISQTMRYRFVETEIEASDLLVEALRRVGDLVGQVYKHL